MKGVRKRITLDETMSRLSQELIMDVAGMNVNHSLSVPWFIGPLGVLRL